jgi:hypothetical protein
MRALHLPLDAQAKGGIPTVTLHVRMNRFDQLSSPSTLARASDQRRPLWAGLEGFGKKPGVPSAPHSRSSHRHFQGEGSFAVLARCPLSLSSHTRISWSPRTTSTIKRWASEKP